MITSTTHNIEGHPVNKYLGVVTSQTIIGANIFKDIFGGRSGTYERVLDEAKTYAMNELIQKAQAMGANAVIGIDLDYETVGNNGSMLMVSASGTAVIIS